MEQEIKTGKVRNAWCDEYVKARDALKFIAEHMTSDEIAKDKSLPGQAGALVSGRDKLIQTARAALETPI